MDEETIRLVKMYGLDNQAREMHKREMHETHIKGICERINRENKGYLAKYVERKAARVVKCPRYASDHEMHEYECKTKQTIFDYLGEIALLPNLKPQNRERIAGLTAYLYIHKSVFNDLESHTRANELLSPIYGAETAREIIREDTWRNM